MSNHLNEVGFKRDLSTAGYVKTYSCSNTADMQNQHKLFRKFLVIQLIFLISALFSMLHFFPIHGRIDLALIQPWINTQGQFYLKDHWALNQLAHGYVKYVLILIYGFFFLIFIASYKFKTLATSRYPFLYFLTMVILSTCLIGVIKSQSNDACPWDMINSTATSYTWNAHQMHGHCFPGGHASTGFALIVGYFIYRVSDPKRALFYLISSLILGFAMGWTQMMRGAHFFSHNLWTLWIIWLLNVWVYALSYSTFKGVVFGVKDHQTQT